ncbi:MAG: hypothetical protein ACRC8S_13910 [Fimbriiglobus sp.]
MLRLLSCGLVSLILGLAQAQEPLNLEKYLILQKGDLPIILSAPHGGTTRIDGVPNREGKGVNKFVTVLDTNTFELIIKTSAAIEKAMGAKPYVVAAKFERTQIDANRPKEDAYESEKAKPYYDIYHKTLKEYTETVRTTWGHGLLLDFHGQAAKANTIYRGTQNRKTVEALRTRFGQAGLTGPNSFLGQLAKRGYIIFPAIDDEPATPEHKGYTGGYIVGTYGSHNGTNIDAIQLEFGGDQRATKNLNKSADDLAEAIKVFAKEFLPTEKRMDVKP